jgi:hypothetical protein
MSRGKRFLVWVVVVVLSLPVLFYVFEYVVPKYLPSNF